MAAILRVTDETTVDELDQHLARLAIWRHESVEAEAQFNAMLEERFVRTSIAT